MRPGTLRYGACFSWLSARSSACVRCWPQPGPEWRRTCRLGPRRFAPAANHPRGSATVTTDLSPSTFLWRSRAPNFMEHPRGQGQPSEALLGVRIGGSAIKRERPRRKRCDRNRMAKSTVSVDIARRALRFYLGPSNDSYAHTAACDWIILSTNSRGGAPPARPSVWSANSPTLPYPRWDVVIFWRPGHR